MITLYLLISNEYLTNMAKIPKRLEEVRKLLVLELWFNEEEDLTVQEIGKIFGISTSLTYAIIKEQSLNANSQ